MQKCIWSILLLFLLLCLPFRLYNKVSNLLHQNGVGEELLSTTDENGEKKLPFIYFKLNRPPFKYQRMSNVPLAHV